MIGPARWAALTAVAAIGCAARPPSPVLVEARRAIAEARSSPAAARALDELREAEDALERAEAAVARGRREAPSEAYVARRKAERAYVAGRYAADLELLARAREHVARLHELADRRQAERREAEKREREEAAARRRGFEAFEAEVEKAGGPDATMRVEPDGPVVDIAAKFLFKPGLTELSERGVLRLGALLEAVRTAPLVRVSVRVTDSSGGVGANAAALARRRAAKLRDAFVEQGVPPDLVTAEGVQGEGRHVRIAFVEERAAPRAPTPTAVGASAGGGDAAR